MGERAPEIFLGLAKVQTFYRDVEKMRNAVRSHDTFATEAAWENLERWINCINPHPTGDDR